ncbi:MAG: hypothetical protein KatS3mg126_0434 [Lysobacteraceae bacterium]|nr:MAG: hypothetical protein KatS3mg126_0434 [Xanthomonadaceae bacterium]
MVPSSNSERLAGRAPRRVGLAALAVLVLLAWSPRPMAAGPAAEGGSGAAALGMIDDAVLALSTLRDDPAQPLRVEQPARVRLELGAVIDPRPADGGPPAVMAVTPGKAAARMGLAAGDRIVAADGEALEGPDAGERLRATLAASHGMLRLEVLRAGRRLAVSGHLDRVALPAYRLEIQPEPAAAGGCGRVSTFLRPPASESLYPAVLHTVDGRLFGSLDATVLRLPAGRHVLRISEAIGAERFDAMQNRRRLAAQRSERFKHLEIEVEPDTKYHLAVRFHPERVDPVRDQAYWEPVIWKRTHEPCS